MNTTKDPLGNSIATDAFNKPNNIPPAIHAILPVSESIPSCFCLRYANN